jgi:hypothetical protein
MNAVFVFFFKVVFYEWGGHEYNYCGDNGKGFFFHDLVFIGYCVSFKEAPLISHLRGVQPKPYHNEWPSRPLAARAGFEPAYSSYQLKPYQKQPATLPNLPDELRRALVFSFVLCDIVALLNFLLYAFNSIEILFSGTILLHII